MSSSGAGRDRRSCGARRAAAGARFVAGRGRAAARPGAWRSRHQRGDGAGGCGPGKPDGVGRADRCCARWPRAGIGRLPRHLASPSRGTAGLSEHPAAPRSLARAIARDPAAPASALAIRRSGGGARVNVEFVSANPTGPMHVGHGRGAVVGDALAALLAQGRVSGRARVLRQRRRRPGRHPRPLDPSALSPGARRSRSGRSRTGSIPANI